jgi:hypothetical protein
MRRRTTLLTSATARSSERIVTAESAYAIGANYDYGGETSIDHVAQDNKADGLRPTGAISTVFGPFRVGLRYENTSTSATDARRNGMWDVRVAMLLF